MTIREVCKRVALAAGVVLASPWILASWIEKHLGRGEVCFTCGGAFFSLVPGPVGDFLRLAYYRCTLQRCSSRVYFAFGSTVSHRATEIGSDVTIGGFAAIGTATIGDHVLISPRSSILSGRRQHDAWRTDQDVTASPTRFERVHIGENCWIGEGAIVLADVGPRCLVAAGAVVFRPAPADRMVMGNPARVVSREFSTGPGAESS